MGTETARAKPGGGRAWIGASLRVVLLAVALPCLSPLSIASAVALPVAASSAPLTAASGDPQIDDRTLDREMASFRAAAISLRQAMTIAQQQHANSKIADISFDGSLDRPAYKVKTLQGDHVLEQSVDAETGAVFGGEIVTPLRELDPDVRANLAALRGAGAQLAEAVIVAERVTAGRAVSGGMTRDAGKLSFAIVVLSPDGLKQVILEPPRRGKR
ncbi:PepSY domain-containing protein [Rhodopseudomonas palustris]|uniref:PepSY domain-containing protein n=1 Tax=Rhodopseudomonas palustris TaxID=1076 RepID=UPI0039F5C5BE